MTPIAKDSRKTIQSDCAENRSVCALMTINGGERSKKELAAHEESVADIRTGRTAPPALSVVSVMLVSTRLPKAS